MVLVKYGGYRVNKKSLGPVGKKSNYHFCNPYPHLLNVDSINQLFYSHKQHNANRMKRVEFNLGNVFAYMSTLPRP